MHTENTEHSTADARPGISAARTMLMGLAIIFIMLFHLQTEDFGWFSFVCNYYGLWGVDVFLFLSGFGIVYSLRRWQPGQSLAGFYAKRLKRLMPACVLCGTLFYLWAPHAPTLQHVLLQVTGMDMWYVRVILLFYLFSPLLLLVVRRFNTWGWLLVLTLLTEVLLALCIYLQPDSGTLNLYRATVCWGLARFPAFLAGMCVAQGMRCNNYFTAALCLLFSVAARLMFRQGEGWLCSEYCDLMPLAALVFAMPAGCYLLGRVRPHLPQGVLVPVEWAGRHSLELYLVHLPLYPMVREWVGATIWFPFTALVLSVLIAAAVSFLIALVRKSGII